MRKSIFIIYILIAFYGFKATAQTVADSINIAKSLIDKGEFKQAENLLHTIHSAHPDNVNYLWLYGQVAYWNHHIYTFKHAYRKAMQINEGNYYLMLDYALKLVDNGDVDEALPLLEKYKQFDSKSIDLNIALAKIYYWQGNSKQALSLLNNANIPAEKRASYLLLKNEINKTNALWFKVGGNFLLDDQPLKVVTPKLEVGKYVNHFVSPSISLTTPYFLQDTGNANSLWFTIGNKMFFAEPNLALNLNAGLINLPNAQKEITASFEVTKTSFKYLQFTAKLAKAPYLTTIASLNTTVMPLTYGASVGWNKANGFNGKVNYFIDKFNNNNITNLSAWVFSPPVKISIFNLRLGYAYAFSNADVNTYTHSAPLATIISNFSETNKYIAGLYNPYFTPTNQQVHSGLLGITGNPNSSIEFGVNANIAFVGSTQNPYLFLDKEQNNLFVNRGFAEVKFYPIEVAAYLLYNVNNNLALKAEYAFLKNNFYTSNTIGAKLIYTLYKHEQ